MKSELTMFESAQRDGRDDRPVMVKLSGELDVRYRRALEDTLRDCLASGRPTLVDLSEVTFMDSLCLRELAIHYQLGTGRVALCDPSQELEVGVAACELEEWLEFVYTTGSGHPRCYAAESVFDKAAIGQKKGNRPCAHPTRR